MTTTPAIIVLYDNDAVEVRYSDESRLELAPCGATMIYHPPPKKGEHPRHGLSSRVHKRTCFVTSDHKKLVLQALDFRNRFAQRPYLCEELLQRETILTLYASVDSIEWPDSVDSANVEIQADGSRKITSLDDFASLVVSPHGQDFSISYLSRISTDEKMRDTSRQLLQSGASYHFSRDSSKCSEQRRKERDNEAVVKPFSHEINDSLSSQMQTACCVENKPNLGKDLENKALYGNCETGNISKPLDAELDKTESELDKTLVELSTPRQEMSIRQIQSGNENIEGHCTDDEMSSSRFVKDINTEVNGHQVENVIIGSPISHDISSISRSSTPDGLRTTIDSDATLINDNNELESLANQKSAFGHHRHSSPTHTSSPFDFNIQQPFLINGQSKQPQNLDGSYLENERIPPLGLDNDDVDDDEIEKTIESHPGKIQNASANFEMNSQTSGQFYEKDNLTDPQKLVHKNIIDTRDVHNFASVSGQDNANSTVVPIQKEVANEKSNHNTSYYSPNYSATSSQNKPVFESQYGKSEFSNIRGMKNEAVMCSQHSPRLLSSVSEMEDETETSCRKKYVWLTCHASRNGCPKNWTHPLMLALHGKNFSEKEKLKKESIKENKNRKLINVPKSLPLTCPFQHNHRIHSHQTNADSVTDDGDSTSRIGEFQQGRLKVVLSEGIIYRLIPSNEMTVVEIYPGDGTVLVSQGVKAIFFTHFIPRVDVLEERTYSLKSLPPGCAKGRHSIEKMMKTANRLVHNCLNWDKRSGITKPPCWQKEVVAVVEPLSSSLLEECSVDGLGRFSAFTNGRVRILFDDRTSLDTVADFTRRLGNTSTEHGNILYGKSKDVETARLLIPSGKYVTVELKRPGQYIKYLNAAKEWISWVNASPAERHNFYKQQNQPHVLQQAAELELKKIFCFNYVLEHSAISHPHISTPLACVAPNNSVAPNKSVALSSNCSPSFGLTQLTLSSSSEAKPVHHCVTGVTLSQPSSACPPGHVLSSHASTQLSPSILSSTITSSFHPATQYRPLSSSTPYPFTHSKRIPSPRQPPVEEDKCVLTTMGFQSVRSALARTSSLINDIEMFLEESKT